MRIMALDLGEKRVGVALSDETQTLATPLEVIQRVSFARLLERLTAIAHEQEVSMLLVGDPRSLSGDVGPQARHIASEAQRIQQHLQLPLVMWDERLSTVRTEQLLAQRGVRRRGPRRQPIDAMVAALILQEYLDVRRAGESERGAYFDDEGSSTHG